MARNESRSMDRRTRRTRKAIFGAFEELLAEESYASITAGQIIERADVGRTTFYAHFQTKDDLLVQLCDDLFAHVSARPAGEEGHDFSGSSSLKDELTHVFYHLREQAERLGPLFRGPSSMLFWSAFESSFGEFVRAHAEELGGWGRGIPEELGLRFLTSSYIEVAKWWFETGLASTPEETCALFLALTGLR